VPGLVETLKVVLGELHIEGAMMAKEAEQKSPAILKEIQAALGTVQLKKISHEKFKEFCRTEPNTTFVRTGEATPFSNIVLIAGVVF
jgi:D-ribose pyranase